jgi:hypothetical protein
LGMNLFYGGYGDYMDFTVASDENMAIKQIGEKINAPFLPVTARLIDGIDGFAITPTDGAVAACAPDGELTHAEPTMPTDADAESDDTETDVYPITVTAPTLRHCKKCDFTCDNQGDLMRHYATAHPKGG